MAGSYNKVVLVGNLVRDPEIRYISTGTAVTKFTLAVNRRAAGAEETDFIDIVAWEKLAETCSLYLKKGSSCLIEGRLSIRSFEDKKGEKRKATEVVASVMQMLDRASGQTTAAPTSRPAGSPAAGRANSPHGPEPLDDDEIPF